MAKFAHTIAIAAILLLSASITTIAREFADEPSPADAITGDYPYYTGIFDITVIADEPSYAEGPNEDIDQVIYEDIGYTIPFLGLGLINPLEWLSSILDFAKNFLFES
ncbi:hypothetical protein J5N97_009024 [Dioscorea zingiberensis]|uniref:Uncharacterized protein n=1 Tax=Dioscorea zingiberensis TaxID=325984 RepID=A0A9D5CX97_9LILI|nr:hypothetical protein J5N97_009024 [Dioscorea zingiberensis]